MANEFFIYSRIHFEAYFHCNILSGSQVVKKKSQHFSLPKVGVEVLIIMNRQPNWHISVFNQGIHIYRQVSLGAAVMNKAKKKFPLISSIF